MKTIFLCDAPEQVKRVYSTETVEWLKKETDIKDDIYNKTYVLKNQEDFQDVAIIFSTWGMPSFTEEEIQCIFPKLEAVFYAAGTVQSFARPFLNCGVKVFSAWAANGVPVAEYTVAQIILANKGFFQTSALQSSGNIKESNRIKGYFPGNYGDTIGIIGAGMIGKMVIRMLKAYNLKVKVFDPFLSDEMAAELGVCKCSLEEIFATCQVVSNHLANNEQTKGMLKGCHFNSMLPYATFLNTGRGAQVVEDDLVSALETRPDLTAVLDVTFPEPPEAGHAFYRLPNCFLTPHIAGSSGEEVHRMAEYMAKEYELYRAGERCKYEVSMEMLLTMA